MEAKGSYEKETDQYFSSYKLRDKALATHLVACFTFQQRHGPAVHPNLPRQSGPTAFEAELKRIAQWSGRLSEAFNVCRLSLIF